MKDDANFDLGLLRVFVDGGTVYTLAVDRFAADRQGLLYLLSVVGPQGEVKSVRATLNAKVNARYEVEKMHVTNAEGRSGFFKECHTTDGAKYEVHHHALGYGQVHATFLLRDPGFIREPSDESLFAAFKNPRYTTPLLRAWTRPIADALHAKGLLQSLYCFRCRCLALAATNDDLDQAVTEGIQDGRLLFRDLNLVGAA